MCLSIRLSDGVGEAALVRLGVSEERQRRRTVLSAASGESVPRGRVSDAGEAVCFLQSTEILWLC